VLVIIRAQSMRASVPVCLGHKRSESRVADADGSIRADPAWDQWRVKLIICERIHPPYWRSLFWPSSRVPVRPNARERLNEDAKRRTEARRRSKQVRPLTKSPTKPPKPARRRPASLMRAHGRLVRAGRHKSGRTGRRDKLARPQIAANEQMLLKCGGQGRNRTADASLFRATYRYSEEVVESADMVDVQRLIGLTFWDHLGWNGPFQGPRCSRIVRAKKRLRRQPCRHRRCSGLMPANILRTTGPGQFAVSIDVFNGYIMRVCGESTRAKMVVVERIKMTEYSEAEGGSPLPSGSRARPRSCFAAARGGGHRCSGTPHPPGSAALHARAAGSRFWRLMPARMIVVAGPPGSGKSSIFSVSSFGVPYFYADDRAAELNGGSYTAFPDRCWSPSPGEQLSRLRPPLRSNVTFEQAARAKAAGFKTEMRCLV
jgi:hypothetical protein